MEGGEGLSLTTQHLISHRARPLERISDGSDGNNSSFESLAIPCQRGGLETARPYSILMRDVSSAPLWVPHLVQRKIGFILRTSRMTAVTEDFSHHRRNALGFCRLCCYSIGPLLVVVECCCCCCSWLPCPKLPLVTTCTDGNRYYEYGYFLIATKP